MAGVESHTFSDARLSLHALTEMARRGISVADVQDVLRKPGQVEVSWPGRLILTSFQHIGNRPYVLRVILDLEPPPATVVTAYRSSKVEKYWRSS